MVDYCAEDRELFADLLQAAGYRVLEANDAQQAQGLAGAEAKIDLLLTDFNLPGMNGAELARWFHSRFPLSKVIIMSDPTRDLLLISKQRVCLLSLTRRRSSTGSLQRWRSCWLGRPLICRDSALLCHQASSCRHNGPVIKRQ